MIPGLMQTTPLMISGILTYAAQAHGATWNGAHKAWVFNGTDAFQTALNAL